MKSILQRRFAAATEPDYAAYQDIFRLTCLGLSRVLTEASTLGLDHLISGLVQDACGIACDYIVGRGQMLSELG
jgi:hypothetical protein